MLLSAAQAERRVLLWVCTPVSLVVAKASQRARDGMVLSLLSLVRMLRVSVYSTVQAVQSVWHRRVKVAAPSQHLIM